MHPPHTAPPDPEEVRLTDTTIAHLEEKMAEAVTRGIRSAMTPETAEMFWSAGLTMLQREAQQHAGRFVIGGLAGLAKKAALFLALGGIVYAVGGWSALAGLFKHLFTQGVAS